MDRMMYKHIFQVDLNEPLKRRFVGLLGTHDNNANRFGAELYREGEAVDSSGCTVKGYFIRPDEKTLTITGGTGGNLVFVNLTAECYKLDGAFTLSVKIIWNGSEQTVLLCDGRIVKTRTDVTVDGGGDNDEVTTDQTFYTADGSVFQTVDEAVLYVRGGK